MSDTDSDSVSSWDDGSSGSVDDGEGADGVEGVMDDKDWSLVARCEVEEASDEWRAVDIYCRNNNPDRICLHFGDDEYEGLPGGSYRFDRSSCHLYDTDGDLIEVRDVVYLDDE